MADLLSHARSLRVCVADVGMASSCGFERAENQDAWGHLGSTFAVADGMGGLPGGQLAAQVAVQQILKLWIHDCDEEVLMRDIDGTVRSVGQEHGFETLGTTLVAVRVGDVKTSVISVGDSRLYHRIGSALRRITRDHNLLSEMVDAGVDPQDYLDRAPVTTGLTSYVGIGPHRLAVRVTRIAPLPGDRLLLCSDGVHGQLDDSMIQRAMLHGSAQEAASFVVELADAAGGADNSTAVVIDLSKAPAS